MFVFLVLLLALTGHVHCSTYDILNTLESRLSCSATQKEKNYVNCECETCEEEMMEIDEDFQYNGCCDCHSSLQLVLMPLELEYTMFGGAEVLGDKGNNSVLQHNHGGLLFIPDNICDFPYIRRLNLSGNMIVSIQKLSCLSRLDELILSHNLIEIVTRDVFKGMTGLRILDVSKNNIHHLDVGTFGTHTPNLKQINFANNRLEEFDFSNVYLNSFCDMNLSGNRVSQFKNIHNISAETLGLKGPGSINIANNHFQKFPDLDDLRLGNITSLGALDKWGFELENNPWKCDCYSYAFLNALTTTYKMFPETWDNNVTCAEPSELKGQRFYEIDESSVICNLTELCPDLCVCVARPSNFIIDVDCQNAGLTELPLDLPSMTGLNLTLNMAGNLISELDDRPYLSRVNTIDLSNNALTSISGEAARSLKYANKIQLSNNSIEYLPKEVQIFPPSVLVIDLDYLNCDCSLTWMPDWLDNYDFNTTGMCLSVKTQQSLTIKEFLKSCIKEDRTPSVLGSILGSLALLAIIVAVLSYVYRYEVMVLAHVYIGPSLKRCNTKVHPFHDIGLFLSVGKEDILWTKDHLIPQTDEEGFTTFFEERDLLPGEVRLDAILKFISISKHALVVISPSYVESESNMSDFNNLCQSKVNQLSGIVSVIFKGEINARDIKNPYLRAFKRLGMYERGVDRDTIAKALTRFRPCLK